MNKHVIHWLLLALPWVCFAIAEIISSNYSAAASSFGCAWLCLCLAAEKYNQNNPQ